LEGPHDQEHIPTASEEDASPSGEELTDEETLRTRGRSY